MKDEEEHCLTENRDQETSGFCKTVIVLEFTLRLTITFIGRAIEIRGRTET